jgi:hypothetical protein
VLDAGLPTSVGTLSFSIAHLPALLVSPLGNRPTIAFADSRCAGPPLYRRLSILRL